MTSDCPECGIAKRKERRSSGRKNLVMAPTSHHRTIISDEQLQTELNHLKDYTGLQLGILKKYTPEGDNNNKNRQGITSAIGTRYVIVDAKDRTELSNSMTKSECYYELRAANEAFYMIHVLKLNRLQQQQQQEKEEEEKKNNDNCGQERYDRH
jgi:hypothetical protein